jgi:hypothetical protein
MGAATAGGIMGVAVIMAGGIMAAVGMVGQETTLTTFRLECNEM